MKYIATRETIILFPKHHGHDEIAKDLNLKVIGAGFVLGLDSGDIDKIECVGESVSLKIKSQPEDTEKLQRIIRGY